MPFTYTPIKLYCNTNTKTLVDSNNGTLYAAGSSLSALTLDVYSRDISLFEVHPLDNEGSAVSFGAGTNFTFVANTGYVGTPLISIPTGEFGANTASLHNPTGSVLAFVCPFTGTDVTGALGSSSELTLKCALWQYPSGLTNPSLITNFDLTLKNTVYPA